MRLLSRIFFFVLSTTLGVGVVQAQPFPSKPVTIIVAYPAGGAADVIVRTLAHRLSTKWDKQVIIENRAGGGTQIAANAVAKSPPDGYVLLATGMETFAIRPFLDSKLSYGMTDFTPVSELGYSNQMLVVPADSPLKSIKDLIDKAQEAKGSLQYGTIGLGGSSHINMVLFESLAGVKMTPVHYRGGAPLLNDLLGGHVPMGFLSVTLVNPGINAGKLHALGVGSKTRLPQFPDVPAISESVDKFEAVSWFGLFAPAGTPAEVVSKINADIQQIFADPDFRDKFMTPNFLGANLGNPDQFSKYIGAEAGKWSKVISDAKLKIE